MKHTTSKATFAIVTFLTLSIASPISAHTPRGSNPATDTPPPTRPIRVPREPRTNVRNNRLVLDPQAQAQFNQNIASLLQQMRTGELQIPRQSAPAAATQLAIADILQSTGRLYRYNETIGELRATVSEPAIPPNEPGVTPERPGYVSMDLKREGSMPGSIASRFSRYVDHLGTQGGEFRIFGNDRLGVSRDIQVTITPRLDRQVELKFTSNSAAMKDAAGKPIIETILVPNAKIASVLAGILPALDAANASLTTMRAATSMIQSLGNLNLSSTEIQQLAQAFAEALIASEGVLSGCGSNAAGLTCTNLNIDALSVAIEGYNNIVLLTRADALVALSKNPEFQTLGEALRRARQALGSNTASR
jgi:hypothetical protein